MRRQVIFAGPISRYCFFRYEMWRTPLDARKNWWGYNETLAIQGRIKDKLDDHGLLRIDFRHVIPCALPLVNMLLGQAGTTMFCMR